MKAFMDRDFLLSTETANKLFHTYAETMPILDYHCHINPQEIAEDSGRLGRLFSSPQERAMEKSEARQERYQENKSDWEEEKVRRREDYIRKSEAREDGDLIGQLSEKAIAWFSTLGGDEKE